MTDTKRHIFLDMDDWWDTFQAVEDDGALRIFDTPEECDTAFPGKQVWTAVDTDGNVGIVQGIAYVNRLHYHVTERTPVHDVFIEVIDFDMGDYDDLRDDAEPASNYVESA